jgi:AraC-like DNA-binding protein
MPSLPGCRAIPLLSDARIECGRQPWTTITFSPELLHQPLPRTPARSARPEDGTWERTKPADDIGGAVQQIVTTLLPDGYPDVYTVAEMVGLSARTLQRRLSEEGLTFARLVARARFDVAQQMLADPARKIIDIALDLGYSDPAHFTRAFARWTGLAPREFQRLRLVGRLGAPFLRSAVHELRQDQSGRLAAARRGR